MGYQVQTGVAQTGVVALLGKGSPVTLLRFDMDALPITEQTGVSYSSTHAGVMHACGHDGHMAIGLTVARIMKELEHNWQGTLKFIFQPAEEGLGGCEQMIKGGILENPRPQIALGMHIWNEKPLGWLGITKGPMMAGAEIFSVKIAGSGGHGALPQEVHDPIVAAAQIITAAQTIISRNISPLETGVVSFTQVQAGETYNVIPPEVLLKGTLRYFEDSTKEILHRRFEEIIKNIGNAFSCTTEIMITDIGPALVNDPTICSRVGGAVNEIYPEMDISYDYQTMGSEDFSLVCKKFPVATFL